MREKSIVILGQVWTIRFMPREKDERLENCGGFTDWTMREIVIASIEFDNCDKDSVRDLNVYQSKVLRHEIIHAYLLTCGLAECSCAVEAWAENEEMVDWFARMGPDIYASWKEANAL